MAVDDDAFSGEGSIQISASQPPPSSSEQPSVPASAKPAAEPPRPLDAVAGGDREAAPETTLSAGGPNTKSQVGTANVAELGVPGGKALVGTGSMKVAAQANVVAKQQPDGPDGSGTRSSLAEGVGTVMALQAGAAAGDRQAQFDLGIAYATGRGIPRDKSLARYWFDKAAAQQHAGAKQQLASLDFSDDSHTNSPPRTMAFEDLKRKAWDGDCAAQYELGIAYVTGRGVAKDLAQARFWFVKSAAQGHAGAKLQLDDLKSSER